MIFMYIIWAVLFGACLNLIINKIQIDLKSKDGREVKLDLLNLAFIILVNAMCLILIIK